MNVFVRFGPALAFSEMKYFNYDSIFFFLKDILQNESIKLDEHFRVSLINDVVNVSMNRIYANTLINEVTLMLKYIVTTYHINIC